MFSSRLRDTRKSKRVTQQFMADALTISLNGYQKYEQNERSPSLDTLVRIADILDVSTDYLLGRDQFLAEHAGECGTCLPVDPTV